MFTVGRVVLPKMLCCVGELLMACCRPARWRYCNGSRHLGRSLPAVIRLKGLSHGLR